MDNVEKSKNKKFDVDAFLDSLSQQEIRDFAKIGVHFTAHLAFDGFKLLAKVLGSSKKK